jgi:hypothetical protein
MHYEIVIPFVTPLVHWYREIRVYIGFVSDLIAIDTMILGVVIPLGYNTVSKTIREYGAYGFKVFKDHRSILTLIPILLIHLTWCLILNSQFVDNTPLPLGWGFILLISFSLIVYWNTLTAGRVTFRVGMDPLYVKDIVVNRIVNAFKKKKFNKYYEHIVGYGVFLKSMIKRGESRIVEDGLALFSEQYEDVAGLWQTDTNTAPYFFYSGDLLEQFQRKELGQSYYFDSDQLLVLNGVNQVKMLYDESVKLNNFEVSFKAQIALIRILQRSISLQSVHLIIEQILRTIQDIMLKTLQAESTSTYISLEWYTSCIFRYKEDPRVLISYFPLFNQALYRTLTNSIHHGQTRLLKILADKVHHDIHISFLTSGPREVVGKLHDLEYGELEKIEPELWAEERRLVKSVEIKATEALYKTTKEKLLELKKSLLGKLNLELATLYESHSDEVINSVEDKYKYDEFRILINHVLAFSIYRKQEIEVIKFWQFKQPDDAGASWGGNTFFEDDIYKFLIFHYQERGYRHSSYEFHDDHHGTEQYLDYYLALRILYNFRFPAMFEEEFPPVPPNNVDLIFGLESSLGNMKRYLENQATIQDDYGIFQDKANSVLKANEFVEYVNSNIEEVKAKNIEMQHLEESKLVEFGDELREGYASKRELLPIIANKLGSDRVNDDEGSGISVIFNSEKAQFIDWRISYSGMGRVVGETIAAREDAYILKLFLGYEAIKTQSSEKDAVDSIVVLAGEIDADLILTNHRLKYSAYKEFGDIVQTGYQMGKTDEPYQWWIKVSGRYIPILYMNQFGQLPEQYVITNIANSIKSCQNPAHSTLKSRIVTTNEIVDIIQGKDMEISENTELQKRIKDKTKIEIHGSSSPKIEFSDNPRIKRLFVDKGPEHNIKTNK